MQHLMKQIYSVMYKYNKFFSEFGVKRNLEKWLENKGELIALLRKHPNWDEEALAVVFPMTETREIENRVVEDRRVNLLAIASEMTMNNRDDFTAALNAATAEYSTSPSEAQIEVIKEKGGIQCVSGQKTSRIIGKLCRQFGVDKHPQFNRVFALLADSLNPSQTVVKVLLSVHPCDYLEMSSKSNSWTSCHGLEHGGYQAGCLSYLTDRDTMMFYTVDKNVSSEYFKAPRRSRQVFCYVNGILLQSRLYPNDSNKEAILKNRNLVQDIIAECLDVPNKWVLRKKDNKTNFFTTVPGSKHYRDYEYSYGVITTLKNDILDEQNPLQIGSVPICVGCGDALRSSGSIKCNCANTVVCQECDETVNVDMARHVDDLWLCHACLHICACCGNPARENYFSVFDGRGNVIHICGDCRQTITSVCEGCSIRGFCSTVKGSRLCPRTAAQTSSLIAA